VVEGRGLRDCEGEGEEKEGEGEGECEGGAGNGEGMVWVHLRAGVCSVVEMRAGGWESGVVRLLDGGDGRKC